MNERMMKSASLLYRYFFFYLLFLLIPRHPVQYVMPLNLYAVIDEV